MRNLLALLGAGVVIFFGLGWYLGWYKISATPGSDGHRQINIDVDGNKIKNDLQKGEEKIHNAISGEKDKKQSQVPGTPTSLRPDGNGGFFLPGSDNPPPPVGTPKLPMPK